MGYSEYLDDIKSVLQENILQYWLKLRDPSGGFYGEVSSSEDVLADAPRGVILNSRIIWAFAAAYRHFGMHEYLDAAYWARDWFLKYCIDHEYGGAFWSVSAQGEPLETKKQLYAQGFAIYGLSELVLACGDRLSLNEAIKLFRLTEEHFADSLHGGYTEALSRDFSPLEDMSLSAHDINADKTMNSHLHILEAYANLYRAWPDPSLKAAVERLLDLLCGKILGPDGHLRLYFKRNWEVIPGALSFGHDIETSWLALECAMALNDPSVVTKVRPFALKMGLAGNEGILPDGSMRYEMLPDGSFDDERQWWVQAEAVVGNLWLWKYHGVQDGLSRAIDAWKYINKCLVDGINGEWWWAVLSDGSLDKVHPKAGFWKCPYHNTRMCLEVLRILA